MAVDFERGTTVGLGADAIFALLADPARVADYVPLVTHVESTAEDGTPAEPEAARPEGLGEMRFFTDTAARRIEWGEPGATYGGSITVDAGTASTSQVTVRLHTRDDLDRAKVEEFLDGAMRGIRRIASGR
jgi:hypothetical protein